MDACACHPAPDGPKHLKWGLECLLSMYRGMRNGVMAGARIRIPYILNALAYGVIFPSQETRSRLLFVAKQLFLHGKMLGQFVLIYKGICCLLRNLGISNGIESLIAGAIGGWTSFGYVGGIAGATSEQITLYLFARGLEGLIRLAVKKGMLPGVMDIRKPIGFKMLAAFSLAVILYLTEYQPDMLRPSFMGVMRNLYHESNSGGLGVPLGFAPIVAVAASTMLGGAVQPQWGLEPLLNLVLGK